MPKQESRAAVQICACGSPDELYVLASDGTMWKYSEFKDLNYWQQLEPLPEDPPDPGEVTAPTRHALLCDALRQLELGANLSELTTQEVVAHCRAAVPDADSDEILAALRAVGRPVRLHALIEGNRFWHPTGAHHWMRVKP